MDKQTEQQLDALAKALKEVSPKRLRSVLVKDGSVVMRVTKTDKATMKATASKCSLSLTEYLTRLHYFASEKLKK